MPRTLALVMPVRGFDDSKSRLSSVLDPAQRRQLAQNCARGVIDRAVDCRRFVVCDDDEVEAWAKSLGAIPVRVQARGLNASLTEAMPVIVREFEVDFFVIAHADLPLPAALDRLIETLKSPPQINGAINGAISGEIFDDCATNSVGQVLLVPDRRGDGTNVLGLAASLIGQWTFEYGQGSFAAHRAQADRLGCSPTIIEDSDLGLDLDTAEDLLHPCVSRVLPKLLPDWNPS